MRFKLIISYEGTRYCGWQVQPNGLSIQTLIQRALETALRHPIALTGAGRTDAGVHALGQVAHFDTDQSIQPARLRTSLNALLPPDIRILEVEQVVGSFHARYSASGKIYHYHLHLGPNLCPMTRPYRMHIQRAFDLQTMRSSIPQLLGTHDFSSFANASGKILLDSVRTLTRLDAIEEEGGVRLEFEGDGFLYKMVRNIVGTLVEVAIGLRNPESIQDLLQKKGRACGSTASPCGLFLIKVNY